MQGPITEPAATNAVCCVVCTPSQGSRKVAAGHSMVPDQAWLLKITRHCVSVCLWGSVKDRPHSCRDRHAQNHPPGTHLPLQAAGIQSLKGITRRHPAVWGMTICLHYSWATQHRCSAGTKVLMEVMHLDVPSADLLHSALFNVLCSVCFVMPGAHSSLAVNCPFVCSAKHSTVMPCLCAVAWPEEMRQPLVLLLTCAASSWHTARCVFAAGALPFAALTPSGSLHPDQHSRDTWTSHGTHVPQQSRRYHTTLWLQGHVQAASEPHNIKVLGDSPARTVSEAQADGLRPNDMPVGLLDAPPAVGCPVLAARGLGARAGLRRSPGGSHTCHWRGPPLRC